MAITASNDRRSELEVLDHETVLRIDAAIRLTRAYLLRNQRDDGHWCAELEGDTILETEYIMTLHYIGRSQEDRARKAANYVRSKALPGGGWSVYPGGPPDVSASAKAYFVLKLLGDDPEAPHMAKARDVIRQLGGLDAANSFTRLYFAIFGQYPWEKCPAVPPELILSPSWAFITIYEMSSWSRGIVVPLSVIWAHKPHCPVPKHAAVPELLVDRKGPASLPAGVWPAVFVALDAAIKAAEETGVRPLREKALRECEKWMVEHFRDSDGIGAIFPPIINSIIALRCLGYDNHHPLTRSQIRQLERLEIEDGDLLRVQPCFSPVWDTAYSAHALLESGLPEDHPALLRACGWLLDKEVRIAGDWRFSNPQAKPGGWFFEYENALYPDLDDTFEVLTTLARVRYPDNASEARKDAAMQRALEWAISMQNSDGGWGAFDRECNKEFLTQIPFADHNAMIDPSTSDITARGIEALIAAGYDRNHVVVRRALQFLRDEQETDGTWFGRWGVNYVYGTWLALCALRAAGEDMSQPAVQRAVHWLRSIQNSDGGWGETPKSYDDPRHKGKGASTASQTAWALMGLMAAGEFDSPNVQRGIAYLLQTQGTDGAWTDEQWTGTGFPKVFYLNYHYYPVYFPLIALGRYRKSLMQCEMT